MTQLSHVTNSLVAETGCSDVLISVYQRTRTWAD